ncbi:TerD family protein [Clostridium ganghwense]|uniref:TerD family protein n=1 Tax=Clostridium ganghwense TaxID=312089 RepID=A0ABT4CM20_9CLOT|nr:TerD family protein [Clostridium ganghwense]MCY6370100.1 TerD family protein [Clostridium ganghwense]
MLNIDNPNISIRNSEQRRYGSLVVETSIRKEKGFIDLSQPVQAIERQMRSTGNIVNSQNSSGYTNVVNSSGSVNQVAVSGESTTDKPAKNKAVRTSINANNSMRLQRGQKISINSKTQNLSKLVVGLDWDVNFNGNTEFDLDTSIFMVDGNNNTAEENFIFYGNPRSRDGGVILDKDHNSLLKDGFDGTVEINLNLIPSHIQKLAFTVTIYEADKRHHNFAAVSNGYFRIIDAKTKSEIINYNFNQGLKYETAVVVAEIYRYKNEWKISPIGSGFNGGLQALCDNYGIDTK